MITHTRLSPGIEFNEIDRSQYDRQADNSIVGTVCLVPGFADRGEDYVAQRVGSMSEFHTLYGTPKNQVEMYMQAGIQEVINRGGVAAALKLPYANGQKDKFAAVTFNVSVVSNPTCVSAQLSAIKQVDPSLSAELGVFSLLSANVGNAKSITMSELDDMKTSGSVTHSNTITIVDITRGEYGKTDIVDGLSVSDSQEILGIMPVLTMAGNAMFYRGMMSTSTAVGSDGVERTESIGDYTPICAFTNKYDTDEYNSVLIDNGLSEQNCVIPLSASTINDICVSQAASMLFPDITYDTPSTLDRRYLKHVSLTVFKVFKDSANGNRINFSILENFTGSLDRMSKDQATGASDYICNIVNANSRYVNMFANVRIDTQFKNAAFGLVRGQTFKVLGFGEAERHRHIDYTSSIIEPLTLALDKLSDINQFTIDLVLDAGISNVAAFAAAHPNDVQTGDNSKEYCNADTYPFYETANGHVEPWKFDEQSAFAISRWQAVQRKFDNFCKYDRKDCMFLSDIFRPIVLTGDEKIVRSTSPQNSIQNQILPKMRHIVGLNSSYSAGYSNWFYVSNQQTGDFFWCPPSIKAAGVYIYTDAYSHNWSAPAGLNRGRILDAVDVSFDPRNDEAGKLYQQSWNYAVSYPIQGIVLEGQKTFQTEKTALDRVNVRRLMLWLERRVIMVARQFLYEGNTPFMRQLFLDTIKPVFEEAKNGDGIRDYAIRCDETLNTDDVIDRTEFRCVCAVIPVKTIEYINLGFIISNQSASVTEEVVRGV